MSRRWPCCVGRSGRVQPAVVMRHRRVCPPIETGLSAFAGFRFPPEVILLAVQWSRRS